MKKLILHCGLHKTGTSTLQKFLYKNKDEMLIKGFDIFDEYPNGDVRFGNLSAWVDHSSIISSDNKTKSKVKDTLYKALKARAKKNKTIIFSSEALAWILDEENIDVLSKKLKEVFDVVKIVFYIRRQDRFAVSHYGQRTKNYSFEKFFYKGSNTALPTLDDNSLAYLNFNQRYDFYSKFFGESHVVFRVFDKNTLFEGDISQDFLKLIGVQLSSFIEVESINQASNFLQQRVNGYLCDSGVHDNSVATMIANKLTSDRILIPSRVEAQKFLRVFEDSNYNLALSLGIESGELFDKSFDMYPKTLDLDYNNTDFEMLLDALSVNLDKEIYLNNETFSQILKIAKNIRNTNPKDSLTLLLILKKFRPDGIVLNKILEGYE